MATSNQSNLSFYDYTQDEREEFLRTLWMSVSTATPVQINETLFILIARLPQSILRDNRPTMVAIDPDLEGHYERAPHQVMRQWTTQLPLRHQGVLLTAIRGCDGAPKEDPSKSLSRMIRRACLNPADERETSVAGGFFGFDPTDLRDNLRALLHSLDQYPLHYVMHLMHASEIIGYKHPNLEFKDFFRLTYALIVNTFHLKVESETDMDLRLTLDRVAAGTTERNF